MLMNIWLKRKTVIFSEKSKIRKEYAGYVAVASISQAPPNYAAT